ncbi:hypothetical protein THAOC_10773, partial [Thalassiosira oceanica]
ESGLVGWSRHPRRKSLADVASFVFGWVADDKLGYIALQGRRRSDAAAAAVWQTWQSSSIWVEDDGSRLRHRGHPRPRRPPTVDPAARARARQRVPLTPTRTTSERRTDDTKWTATTTAMMRAIARGRGARRRRGRRREGSLRDGPGPARAAAGRNARDPRRGDGGPATAPVGDRVDPAPERRRRCQRR